MLMQEWGYKNWLTLLENARMKIEPDGSITTGRGPNVPCGAKHRADSQRTGGNIGPRKKGVRRKRASRFGAGSDQVHMKMLFN